MTLLESDPDSEVRFDTPIHQHYFSIVLVDFLSSIDKKSWPTQMPYLRALRCIVEKPKFNVNDSVVQLRNAVQQFVVWLEETPEIDIWLPTVDIQTNVAISRKAFLKMCGNISKHNFLRSSGIARELQEALMRAGHSIAFEDALLALSDFYERFHFDILNYHAGTIAEFLNNLRWGIHEYLWPEYERSMECDRNDSMAYFYTYPKGITNLFARTCYWDLMNQVRGGPIFRRFKVRKNLKRRY